MLEITTGLIFVGVALAIYGFLGLVISDDRRVSKRLKGLTEYETSQVKAAEPLLMTFRERVAAPIGASVAGVARAFWPAGYANKLREKLDRAAHPRGMDLERLVLVKATATLGTAGLLGALSVIGGWRIGPAVFVIVSAGILAFFAPDIWLDGTMKRRQRAIVRQLPDLLDMLTISVEAGLGFDAALAKVVRSTTNELSEEFGRVLQKIQAGSSRKEALRAFADRIDVSEIHSFTASLIQADMFGVSIAKVLRIQASEMRLVRRQRAEELAQKAPVKMVFPLILCILPATIIVILGPAILKIVDLFGM